MIIIIIVISISISIIIIILPASPLPRVVSTAPHGGDPEKGGCDRFRALATFKRSDSEETLT